VTSSSQNQLFEDHPFVRSTSKSFLAGSQLPTLPPYALHVVASLIHHLSLHSLLAGPAQRTIRAVSLSARTAHSAQHFLSVMACRVHHLTLLLTAIQAHSLLARTGPPTCLSIAVAAGPIGWLAPLLWHISLSFLASIWLPDSALLSHYILVCVCPFFPVPLTLPWRWRQHGHLKCWYPWITLHGIATQKASTWRKSHFWFCAVWYL